MASWEVDYASIFADVAILNAPWFGYHIDSVKGIGDMSFGELQ